MSSLAEYFQRRQPRPPDSISTVSSLEAEEHVNSSTRHERESKRQDFLENQARMIFNWCNDVKIGEHITNVHYNYLIEGDEQINLLTFRYLFAASLEDKRNPALVLNDENVELAQKVRFILRQKWFWALLLIFLLFSLPNLIVSILLVATDRVVIVQSRAAWGAKHPNPGLVDVIIPVDNIIVTHTADEPGSCTTQAECTRRLQSLQRFYLEFLADIPFNFMIGDDGFVYEGRGFRFRGEVPRNVTTSDFGDVGIFVAFIGTFTENQPSARQISTFNSFLELSIRRDVLSQDYRILLQDQLNFNGSASRGLESFLEGQKEFTPRE